jgi:hypothetical protein
MTDGSPISPPPSDRSTAQGGEYGNALQAASENDCVKVIELLRFANWPHSGVSLAGCCQ